MTGATLPAMTLAEAEALLGSIGWCPGWSETELLAATSKFGPLKFDRVKRAIAITTSDGKAP